MDISQSQLFLQYTIKQSKADYNSSANVVVNEISSQNAELNHSINYVSKTEGISVENIGSTISDEALESIYTDTKASVANNSNILLSTTYKDFSPSEISKIKQLIYELHHQSSEDEDEPTEPPVNPSEPDVDKKSFISDFSDTETLFEYMNKINPNISVDAGVTKAQLIEFTQNDDWEDANYDFFGSLNRVFSLIDANNDGTLSYAEIEDYIGEELGDSFIQYKNKVNLYCDELQSEYEKLSSQKKLEFAIDKAREYLTARNMSPQLQALDRLINQTDLYNTIHVGQIAIADLNKNNSSNYITLGAYNYYSWTIKNYDNGVNVGDYGIWSHDRDDNSKGDDLGITLDISLLDENWYILVNTLVHELTHATAYQYYTTDEEGNIPRSTLTKLYNAGAMNQEEYNFYNTNFLNLTEEQMLRLDYLTSCLWGEYSAYQADADYNDSIGQDVYQRRGDDSTTAVNGPQEKQTILDHVANSYDKESIPDYKWWSYA